MDSQNNPSTSTRLPEPRRRKVTKIRYGRVFLALVVVIALTYFLVTGISRTYARFKASQGKPKPAPTKPTVAQAPQNTEIPAAPTANPSPEPPPPPKVADMKILKQKIEQTLEGFPGTVGLIFYDFETGERLSINSEEVFESASLIKIPIMVEVYQQAGSGSLALDKELELMKSYIAGGSGILKTKKLGSHWSVEKLVDLMITQSDNTATDMLIDLVGMKNVERTAKDLGMKDTTIRRHIFDFAQIEKGNDNTTSPEDMFILLRELYEGNNINAKYRGQMLDILKNQENVKMLPRYLPRDLQIAHKTGSLTGVVHDVGIVYPLDRKPYMLILMSKSVSNNEKAEEYFANVSREVYKYLMGD